MRRWALKAAVAALLLALPACAGVPPDAGYARQGARALEQGQYQAAEKLFQKALAANPRNASALLNLGVVYQNSGRPALARKAYARLIELARTERAARVARLAGAEPLAIEIARQNLADLDTEAAQGGGAGEIAALGRAKAPAPRDLGTLYAALGKMYENLAAMAESLREASGVLKQSEIAAAEKRGAPADGAGEKAAPASPPAKAAPAPGSRREKKVVSVEPAPPPKPLIRHEAASGPLKVHIASFRSISHARRGWQVLKKANADLLGHLKLDIKRVDLGPGMGVFYRVRAGPLPDEASASRLCAALKKRKLYCALDYF